MSDERERPEDDGRPPSEPRPRPDRGGRTDAPGAGDRPRSAALPAERRPEDEPEVEAPQAGAPDEPEEGAGDAEDHEEQRSEGKDETPARSGRQRLVAALWPPRLTRAQLIVALLLFVLGLGLAIQVRSTSENSALRGARQEDLVRILDELDGRTKRLEEEKQQLQNQRTELENSSDQAEEARKQTRQKERQLGVLAGTVAAQGPGIHLTIEDPDKGVEADMLLDTIQELRAAGAEAIQVNNVRVVAGSYFSDSGTGVAVDGRKISAPYRFEVIGKPQDLEPALNIPGGVVQSMEKERATVKIERSQDITVDALRSAKRPDHARSSSQ
ncbi:DUF881 domain-containing protein [Streptomyces sp. NPDC005438]|uniref:DUF881 domain-containing protein n=1 Tax=Streptomyces sp. NPDC005438 TaxID=3156880 RepID=UPI00339FB205